MATGLDFDPENFERQSFELVRRGFEPLSVQRELQRAASVVRDLQRQVAALDEQLNELQRADAEPLEARRVAEALGAEATQVLDAAHAAALERAERAEREAEAVRAEAIAAADAIRAEANADRDQILADAARDAEAVAEEGRQRGRDMVNEAQIVRERMLGDLARKRQTGRAQVEQLRAGRDRLLESLSIAQSSLDTAMKDLVDSVPEARSAAERAGMRIANEPTPTVDVMEAEIESARLVGHPLVDGVPEPGVADEPEGDDPAFITAEMEALTHIDAALEAEAEEEAEAEAGAGASDVAAEPDTDVESTDVEAGDEPGDMSDVDTADEPGDAHADSAQDEAEVFDQDDAATAASTEEPVADEPDDPHEPERVDDSADGEAAEEGPDVDDDGAELFEPADDAVDDGADLFDDTADPPVDEASAADEPVVGDPDDDESVVDEAVPAADESSDGFAPADDIFARLRERQAADDGDDDVAGDEAEDPADDDTMFDDTAASDGADDEAALIDLTGDDAAEEQTGADAEAAGDGVVDPDAELIERAVSSAVRAVKKVLVEEQGTLLDGIRRSGGDAVAVVVADDDAHAEPYESAAEPALVELAEALGGTPDAATLEVGFEQIRAVALEPVRQRLLEVAETSDDADELSDTVRGLYRESRSRRLPSAVAAAASAVRGAVAISVASGEVRWQVDPEGPCGPDCADNALAGPVSAGSPFPTGALHPPTEPNCTCRLVAI